MPHRAGGRKGQLQGRDNCGRIAAAIRSGGVPGGKKPRKLAVTPHQIDERGMVDGVVG